MQGAAGQLGGEAGHACEAAPGRHGNAPRRQEERRKPHEDTDRGRRPGSLNKPNGPTPSVPIPFFKFAFPGKFLQTNRNVRDYEVLTNLPICNLFFCYSLQIIFLGKYFSLKFLQLIFFAIVCNLFFANLVDFFLILFANIFFGKSGIF